MARVSDVSLDGAFVDNYAGFNRYGQGGPPVESLITKKDVEIIVLFFPSKRFLRDSCAGTAAQ